MSISGLVDQHQIEKRVSEALDAESLNSGRPLAIGIAELIPLITAIPQIITAIMSACNPGSLQADLKQAKDNPGSRAHRKTVKWLAKKMRDKREQQAKAAMKAERDNFEFWVQEAENAIRTGAVNITAAMELKEDIDELDSVRID